VTLRGRNRKIVLILLAVAIILRIGMSVVTEHHPIFPGYYYTDASIYEKNAWEIA